MKRAILIITCSLFFTLPATAQVAVIANKAVPEDTIKKTQLLDFYTGDIKKWNDALPTVVFDLKPRTQTKDIFYDFLGKSSARMKSIWLKKMLSGEGDPPESLDSEDEMLKKVTSTPGAIGFVNQAKVKGDVKTLYIIKE